MRNDIKDVQWCTQKQHMVPRNEMTKMLTDNGHSWRQVCKTCKDSVLERRENRKQTN